MALVLVSVVGRRDPLGDRDGAYGACLTVGEHLKELGVVPDRVVLIANQEISEGVSFEERARETGSILQEMFPEAGIVVCCREFNPAVAEEAFHVLRDALDSAPTESSIHFNVSSGTPGTAAAMTALALSERFREARLWQVLDPRYEVDPNQKGGRVVECHLTHERRAVRIREAQRALRSMDFDGAAETLKQLGDDATVQWFSEFLVALALWDRGQYREAKKSLDGLGQTSPNAEVTKVMDTWCALLAELVRGDLLTVALDLYASLSRRMAVGNYVNVATRCRSAIEKLLRYVSGCWTGNADTVTQLTAGQLVRIFSGSMFEGGGQRVDGNQLWANRPQIQLQARTCFGIKFKAHSFDRRSVDRLVQPADAFFERQHGRSMNETLELHGVDGVTFDESRQGAEHVRRAISAVAATAIPEPSSMPFGNEEIRALADDLPRWLPV